MSKIAEWWWAHEFVRIVVAITALVAWVYVLVREFFRPFIEADERWKRWRYEHHYQEELETRRGLDELNRKLESGELPK